MNIENPYANEQIKIQLAMKTSLTTIQVHNWLRYTRKSTWFRNILKEKLIDGDLTKNKELSLLTRNLINKIKK